MDGQTLYAASVRPATTRACAAIVLAMALAVASGCSSSGGVRGALDKGLQAIGMGSDETRPRVLPLRLHAGDNLNAGSETRPLSLVVRVYQLRDAARFEAAPFDVFLDEQRESDALGSDLLRVTEVLLAPGQRHEVLEQLSPEGTHLGVVALFREPAPTRWRMTFDTREVDGEAIAVSLHACAMTTASDALVTELGARAHSLASSRCVPPPG